MVSGLRQDKAHSMTENDPNEEPAPTSWPKRERAHPPETWPPELDEETWDRDEGAVEHEE